MPLLPFSKGRGAPARAVSDPPQQKSEPLVAVDLTRRGESFPSSYSGLARKGYRQNPIVYRCVRLIAEAAASVPMRVSGKSQEEVNALLGCATPLCPAGSTLEAFFGQLQIAGSAYLEAVTLESRPVALRALRPDRVEIATSAKGQAMGWRVDRGGRRETVRIDPVTFRSPILAMHLFDPLEPAAGHGPLEASASAVHVHNEGARWVQALLRNSARPSGALVYSGPPGDNRLTDQQFDRLKGEMQEQFQGPSAAGRPLLLEGGLDWRPMAMSPADMDFIEARREAAREIAFAFGVPPMLLGIPGDNTYSNYREANLAFWRQTVLPLAERFSAALSDWLTPWFGDTRVTLDLDAVPALSSERDALWSRVSAAPFLSDSERRALLGLQPLEETHDA